MTITIKDFMETINYRVTDGSEYGWRCYGSAAYSLDSWDGIDKDEYSVGIVFDTRTQTVYEMSACDYLNSRAYRWINPLYQTAHNEEAKEREVNTNQAWDDVNYIHLETEEDILEKAKAIVNGTEYDTRVSVPLNLDKDSLFELMKMAHEQDMTLNELVEDILRDFINEFDVNE